MKFSHNGLTSSDRHDIADLVIHRLDNVQVELKRERDTTSSQKKRRVSATGIKILILWRLTMTKYEYIDLQQQFDDLQDPISQLLKSCKDVGHPELTEKAQLLLRICEDANQEIDEIIDEYKSLRYQQRALGD